MGLFQPLSTFYSIELDRILDESAGTIAMSKSFFWPIFKVAFDKAFTEKNIQSAFRKAGIWPTNGINIVKSITRLVVSSPPKAPSVFKAPRSSKYIRRF